MLVRTLKISFTKEFSRVQNTQFTVGGAML